MDTHLSSHYPGKLRHEIWYRHKRYVRNVPERRAAGAIRGNMSPCVMSNVWDFGHAGTLTRRITGAEKGSRGGFVRNWPGERNG